MKSNFFPFLIILGVCLMITGCGDFFGFASSDKKIRDDVSLEFNFNGGKTVFILTKQDSSPTSSNLYAVNGSNELMLAQAGTENIPFIYLVRDVEGEHLYLALDIGDIETNSQIYRLVEKNNCTVFKVSLTDNSYRCLIEGIAIDQFDSALWGLITTPIKPIQVDEAGQVYVLGRSFSLTCFSRLSATRYPNGDAVCSEGQQSISYGEFSQIYVVSSDINNNTITEQDQSIRSFVVFPNGELAYLSSSDGGDQETLNLQIGQEKKTITLSKGGIQQYALFNEQALMWNNTEIIHWQESAISHASIASYKVANGMSMVGDGRVYSTSDDLLFQLLPPQVKAKSIFHTTDNLMPKIGNGFSVVVKAVGDEPNKSHNIVINDLKREQEYMFLADKHWLVRQWELVQSKLLFAAVDQDAGNLNFAEIELSSLADAGSIEKLLQITNISTTADSSYAITDFEILQSTVQSPNLESVPYISDFHASADNANSISVDFSQPMNRVSMLENLRFYDSQLNPTTVLPLWLGDSLHLVIDGDGFANNTLETDNSLNIQLVNQLQLLPHQQYFVEVDATTLAANGRSLGEFTDLLSYPLNKSFTTLDDGKTYIEVAENFHRELDDAPVAIVANNVLAQSACVSDCEISEYDLAIDHSGNIRHEFSISSNHWELMLWNKTKFSASYNFAYSHDIRIQFDEDKFSISSGEQQKTLQVSVEDQRYWLTKNNVWRRYRVDVYGTNIKISVSQDNASFTELAELSINNATNFSGSTDETTWLMSFSGAIDQWQSSILTNDNNLAGSEGDVADLDFDNNAIMPGDNGLGDLVGFDDNLDTQYPITQGPGSPDNSFGLRGGAYFGGETDSFGDNSAIAVDGSGRVLVATKISNGQDSDMVLWRLTADGELDQTFADNGKFVHHNAAGGNFDDSAEAVVVDENSGAIYVAGSSYNGTNYVMTLWRLMDDGELDASFNSVGYVTYPANTDAGGFSLALDANDRVVVAGVSDSHPALWVYHSSGVLDVSFKSSGLFTNMTNQGSFSDVVIDNTNDIIATGDLLNLAGDVDMLFMKISASGSVLIEKLFDGVAGNEGNETYGVSLMLDNMQKPVIFGYEWNNLGYDLAVWRLDTNGNLDNAFNAGGVVPGRVVYDSGDLDFAYSATIDSAGYINLLASSTNQDLGFYIVRYDASGNLDVSFDNDGLLTRTAFSGRIVSTMINGSEKLVVSGSRVRADGFTNQRGVWRINLD